MTLAVAVAGSVAAAAPPTPAERLALDVAKAHPEFHLLGAASFRNSKATREAVGADLAGPLGKAHTRRVDILGFDGDCGNAPQSLQLGVTVIAAGSSARATRLLRTLRESADDGGAALHAASASGRFEGKGEVASLGKHKVFKVRLVRDSAEGIGGIGDVIAARVRSSVLVVSAVCSLGGARNTPLDDLAAVADLNAAALAGATLEHLSTVGRAAGT